MVPLVPHGYAYAKFVLLSAFSGRNILCIEKTRIILVTFVYCYLFSLLGNVSAM